MTTDTQHSKTITLVLLCAGYFIDFYDLTIFSASYTKVLTDLFHITNTTEIQNTYLNITNYYTGGIIIGAITFGMLGDWFGRAYIIRYSILIYSLAILLSINTHSLVIFTILRVIAGFGLATEFATSSVLLAELFNTRKTSFAISYLYLSGILGGITAVYIGTALSWQIMFILGGLFGIILYFFRKKLLESTLFLTLSTKSRNGSVIALFNNYTHFKNLFKLLIIILPFNFIISIMFILPSFMPISTNLNTSIHILLIGFFVGNIISTCICGYIINYFKDYRFYIWGNLIIFMLVIPSFWLIHDSQFLLYSILIGLLGGGLPTVWIQMVNKSFPTSIRNTASNTLYALGRGSAIIFNLLLINWIHNKTFFSSYIIISCLIISCLIGLILFYSKNSYQYEIQN